MARLKKRDDGKRTDFLEFLSQTASVTKACEAVHISRRTAYNWRNSVKGFADKWDEAVELGSDFLEDEAIRRGTEGTKRPVYQGGKLVGHVQEYSDTLLIFMLKGRRPEKFKDRVGVESSGSITVQLVGDDQRL